MVIKKIWPIPPIHKRRLLPFFFVSKDSILDIKIERDSDYLIYQSASLIEKISLAAMFFAFIGLMLNANYSVYQELNIIDNINITSFWGHIVVPIYLIIWVGTYLRARLSVNIQNDQLPAFFIRKEWLNGASRSVREILALICIFGLFFPFSLQYIFLRDSGLIGSIYSSGAQWKIFSFSILMAGASGQVLLSSLSAALLLEKYGRSKI